MRFGRRGFGGVGPIEVSEEFKQTVINIAENDSDVQNLITEGYNATAIRPILKTVIDAEGNVVTKATSAVLILQKDTTGYATVTVDIEGAKVTQIVILTRTVIDKPKTKLSLHYQTRIKQRISPIPFFSNLNSNSKGN
jgi:hypothetical protein